MSEILLKDNEIRRRFRELREGLGLSQRELAEKMGVTQGTVAGWERKDPVPSLERRAALAAMADVPVSYLITENDERDTDQPVAWTRLRVIQMVADGRIPKEELTRLLPESDADQDYAEVAEQARALLGQDDDQKRHAQ